MDEITKEALYLLIAIVDRGKRKRVRKVLEKHGVHFSLNFMGMGTARTDLLQYLGIGERERDIVMAAVPGGRLMEVLGAIAADLKIRKQGNGILFALTLTSVAGRATLDILRGDQSPGAAGKGENMKHTQAELIITIVQRGYAHDVVEAAKSAGAQGATVLHGRASGEGDVRRFYGITVEPQKDVVLMLVRTETVSDVMRAICARAGLKTAGLGISFSLPVTDVVGALGFENPPYVEGRA